MTQMTENHPITPPPELVRQWMERTEYDEHTWFYESYIAEQAARWGADQELEACCALMDDWGLDGEDLMLCRRPKPLSLKEQALEALDEEQAELSIQNYKLIRAVLESLPDHE
jgi:hypothetical protein